MNNTHRRGVRRPGASTFLSGMSDRGRRMGWGLLRASATSLMANGLAGDAPSRSVDPRNQEERSTSACSPKSPKARLLLPDRAGCRLRCLRHEDHPRWKEEGRPNGSINGSKVLHPPTGGPTAGLVHRLRERPTRTPATAASRALRHPEGRHRSRSTKKEDKLGQQRARLQHGDHSPSTRPRSQEGQPCLGEERENHGFQASAMDDPRPGTRPGVAAMAVGIAKAGALSCLQTTRRKRSPVRSPDRPCTRPELASS